MAECSANSSYEASALVQAIHDTPRFGEFYNVTNQFQISLSYFEPLFYWIAAPFVLSTCIFIAIWIYCCCICCCCCGKERENSKKANKGCMIFISLLITLSLAAVGAGIYVEVGLHRGIAETISLSDNIQDTAELVVSQSVAYPSADVSQAIDQLSQELGCLSLNEPVCSDLNVLYQANSDIDQALSSFNTIFGSINSTIGEAVLFVVSSGAVNLYETIRHWSVIGCFCVVCLMLLVVWIAVLSSSSCAIIYFLVDLFFVTSLIWDALGGLLVVTIVFADICIDPIDVIGNFTGVMLTSVSGDNFYISCNCNPFASDFDMLNSALSQADVAVTNVMNTLSASQTNAMAQVAVISNALAAAETSSTTIMDFLQCQQSDGTTAYFDQILYNFCGSRYDYLAALFFLLAGLAVLLVIIIVASTYSASLVCSSKKRSLRDDSDLVPFDNRHTTWRNSFSASYSKPYSASNPLSTNVSHTPSDLTPAAPPNYTELQQQIFRQWSEEYDRYNV